jgi:hypothetical protein
MTGIGPSPEIAARSLLLGPQLAKNTDKNSAESRKFPLKLHIISKY